MNEWIEAFRVSTVQGSRKSAKREREPRNNGDHIQTSKKARSNAKAT
jgi:hypothetical protein